MLVKIARNIAEEPINYTLTLLNFYASVDIAFYGFSSGGGLLAYMQMYNQTLKTPLPKPEKYIGIAPGGCLANKDEYKRMLEHTLMRNFSFGVKM